ncbi:MAG: hypothetical protein NTX84_00515 [Nitrospirae bacterium]|nr:hypothetical protein [Nitrospirota bacterium]
MKLRLLQRLQYRNILLSSLTLLFFTVTAIPSQSSALDWVPTDEEIKKYRQSWNPLSHGPVLLQAVDTQPKGQLSIREFLFSQIGESSFGNRLGGPTDAKNGPVHLYQLSPSINTAYGLTNHIEVGAAISMNSFWATQNGQSTSSTGFGDTSLIMKYRPIIQDPGGWRPSITHYTQIVLPTSRWADAEKPPGGFSPLGRLPSTRFGEYGLTQGLMTRKNLEPIRISAAVFYTYAAPGENSGKNTYTGDIVNTRLIFEHILNGQNGFGYNIEVSTLHGLTWRADGHEVNAGQKSGFTIIGVEPALQWNFSQNWLVAVGCQFTVAGQNAVNAIYPNLSVFWFWDKSGKIVMS